AERLGWWTVANLTTNALHLEEGQAEEDLRRLWVVLAQGTPEAVLQNADVRRVYLGDDFRL
ncbi:MAG: hypothetical protein ACK4MU_05060, partial [Thermomonas sp.]